MRRWAVSFLRRVCVVTIFFLWFLPHSPDFAPNRLNQSNLAAAIIFLVGTEEKDFDDFVVSLSLYSKFALILSRYPLLIFHEGGKVSKEERYLMSIAKGFTLKFIQVKLGPREGFDPHTPLWKNNTKRGGLSYYNMIRWNVIELFKHPDISNLEYVMRLDSDSEIRSTIMEDLFVIMDNSRSVYAYKFDSFETKDFGVTDGLANFARSYIHANDLLTTNEVSISALPHDGSMPAFYNNFEIIYVPFLKSKDVWKFINAIDSTDMIYRKRWGDAPIRYLIMNIFAEQDQVWKVSKDVFQYCHPPVCDNITT